MPSSVPTDQAEKEYKDYVRRRQEAGFNGERMTASRFVPSRGTSSKDRPKLTGHGKYDLPSNEYKSSGFTQRSSELGEDPLTAVRTMRNNLRRLAIMHKNGDRPVKAHLCESACDELTKKEEEIAKLGQQRSTAIMMGNTKEAERLTGKMNEVKESALQGSYADLIVEGDQMKAFGVDSKWTPHGEGFLGDDTRPMNDQGNTLAAAPRATSSQRPSSTKSSKGKNTDKNKDSKPKGRFRPRGYIDPDPPKEEKLPSRSATKNGQDDEAKRREQLRKEREARTYTNDTDVKKNARLSSVLAGGSTSGPRADGMDDPFAAPTHVGTCPHCGITQNGLGRNGQMDKHYARECKMMNTCKNCLKVVLVPQLTDHYISRCEFVQGRMTHCNDCGLAIDKQDQARGSSHPLCRGRPPPSGAVWCPLCSIAVEDNPESWQKHCVSDCLGNPRQDGPQMDYQQYQDQARAYDDPPRAMTAAAAAPRAMSSGRARTPSRSGSRKGSRPPSNGRPATNGKGSGNRPPSNSGTPNDGPRGVVESQEPVYVGRMIDADKLVAALSEIQEKKKKAKRQALKDAL